MSRSALRRCVVRWGVQTAGVVTLGLYGVAWLAGVPFVDLTLVVALFVLSPGCLLLGLVESGVDVVGAASNAGVVLDAETRQRAGASTLPRVVPLGVLLVCVGVQGIVLTVLVSVVS